MHTSSIITHLSDAKIVRHGRCPLDGPAPTDPQRPPRLTHPARSASPPQPWCRAGAAISRLLASSRRIDAPRRGHMDPRALCEANQSSGGSHLNTDRAGGLKNLLRAPCSWCSFQLLPHPAFLIRPSAPKPIPDIGAVIRIQKRLERHQCQSYLHHQGAFFGSRALSPSAGHSPRPSWPVVASRRTRAMSSSSASLSLRAGAWRPTTESPPLRL